MKKHFLVFLVFFLTFSVSAQNFTDSNLPIVVIETDNGATIPDEPKILATMKIIWHQDGSRNYLTDIDNPEFLNYNGRIGIERRGSSSQQFNKKPYGLETLQDDDVTNNNVSILGMPKENDWILNSLADDQTGMRDFLSYELSNRIGQYASRGVYCEVMINGNYKGLYIFMEKIKPDDKRINWLNNNIGSEQGCSDSLMFMEYYNTTPFGQYQRKLSNKSENLVLADAWGNIIDEVHYADSLPWPKDVDGNGPYLQLKDLNFDNSLASSWTTGDDLTGVHDWADRQNMVLFPNPTSGMIHIELSDKALHCQVVDVIGNTLMEIASSSPSFDLDLSHLSSGMYLLKVLTEDGKTMFRKVVKQ